MKLQILKVIFIVCIIQITITSCVRADNIFDVTSVDSLDFQYLKDKYPFPNSINFKQYESDILAYKRFDSINGIKSNQILFGGSSTILYWNSRLEKDMYPLPVINRGFGGSNLMQNIYYFNSLVKPHSPLIEVFYCANDYNANPNTVLEYFRYYEYLFHDNFPKSTLYYVSTNPSINIYRKAFINNIDSTNKLIKNYIKTRTNTFFIDTFHSLMPNGVFDLSYFGPDSLHLNDKGYDLMTAIIKPIIKEKYQSYSTLSEQDTSINMQFVIYDRSTESLTYKSTSGFSELIIFDELGRVRIRRKILEGIGVISLNNFNTGVYIACLAVAGKVELRQKIII